MATITEYAQVELNRLLNKDACDSTPMQRLVNQEILAFIEKISDERHSGYSRDYAVSILERLLASKPIEPLTGDEDEWCEAVDLKGAMMQVNKRCSSVVRNTVTGTVYDIDKFVFSDNGGETIFYTNRFLDYKDSTVTFPYTPPVRPTLIYIREDPDHREVLNEVTDPDEIKKMAEEYRRKQSATAVEAFNQIVSGTLG